MKFVKFASICAAVLLAAGTAQGFDPEAGDGNKGKDDVAKCKACHDGTKTAKLNPGSKTKKQWSRFFEEDQKKLVAKHADWATFGLSNDQLQNIHRFLVERALDSDKPQTCD